MRRARAPRTSLPSSLAGPASGSQRGVAARGSRTPSGVWIACAALAWSLEACALPEKTVRLPAAWRTTCDADADAPVADLGALLESFRAENDVPALGAAVVCRGRVVAIGVAGVRRKGHPASVTIDDPFHLGSCTKAMTATLAARLIEQGRLSWDTSILDALPELADDVHPAWRSVTLRHLLQHRGGVRHRNWPEGMDDEEVYDLPGDPRAQRMALVRRLLASPPELEPGSAFVYSNNGYIVAGTMIERLGGASFEDLMRDEVFVPLGLESAGFGAAGSPGGVTAPWPHEVGFLGRLVAVEPGPRGDLPVVSSPAGRAHASLSDWARFLSIHLEEDGSGAPGFLGAQSLATLHSPSFGGDYAMGFLVAERPWSRGPVLTHGGSNGRNHCVFWMSPGSRFAVLVATNRGGDEMVGLLDRICTTLIVEHLGLPAAAPPDGAKGR